MIVGQFDLFAENVGTIPEANQSWQPTQGSDDLHKVAQEILHRVSESKLSDWQEQWLKPHLNRLLDKMAAARDPYQRWFELGYIISALEVEQLMKRSEAMKICSKYRVTLS